MASRLLRREVQRLVRHRTLVAAKKVNEQKNFISLLHQQILNNLKDSKIDNLYPIGKGITLHILELVPFSGDPWTAGRCSVYPCFIPGIFNGIIDD